MNISNIYRVKNQFLFLPRLSPPPPPPPPPRILPDLSQVINLITLSLSLSAIKYQNPWNAHFNYVWNRVGNMPPIQVSSGCWTGRLCQHMARPGVGVTKPISSVPLFSKFFSTVKIRVNYQISYLYLTGVAAARLRWHLSNINVIEVV